MTHEEYKEKRDLLLNEANQLADIGDLTAAEEKAAEVEKLDALYESQIEAAADQKALADIKPETPEFVNKAEKMEENKMPEIVYNKTSIEYKNAWLKEMARNADGKYLLGAPSVEETNAYTITTGNTPAVVPTVIEDRIIDLVESYAPMYADATKPGLEKGFAVPRHASISAGDAAATNEGVANADEQSVFNQLALDGVEIKKHVKITRKMSFQSIDSFENWLVSHIAERIANAKEARIISQLDNTTYGIAAANKLTDQACTDATIRTIFSMIKGAGPKVIYANGTTIWTKLFGILDGEDRQLFVPSSMEDPLVQGRIYGALVKQDENVPNNTVYVGIPSKILANDFDALATARDMDVTTWVTTISGYSLFDAGLENPLSFVKAVFS